MCRQTSEGNGGCVNFGATVVEEFGGRANASRFSVKKKNMAKITRGQ